MRENLSSLVPSFALALTVGFHPMHVSAAPQEEKKEEKSKVTSVITVTGKKTPPKVEVSNDIQTLPANAAIMTDAEISAQPARDAGEVIRALPGMDYVYYGQGGIPSGPSVRGYTDRNFGQDIAGFIDGIPLNLAGFVSSHGAMDMTPIFPEAVERIELIRGPFSARYGDFHRGASLNFVTRDGVTSPSVSLALGSHGSQRVVATYGNYDPNRISIYSNIDVYNIDGYADNQKVKHVRSFNKIFIPAGAFDYTVTAHYFSSDWDAPSYLSRGELLAGRIDEKDAVNPTDGGGLDQALLALRFRHGASTKSPLVATVYGSTREWLRFRHDSLISATQTQTRQQDDRTTFGYRVEKSFSHSLFGRPSLFLAGTTLQRDDAETKQDRTLLRRIIGATDNVDVILTNAALYAQHDLGITKWLKLSTGLRYSDVDYGIHDNIRAAGTYVDSYSDSKVDPKVGIVVTPIETLELFAQYATGMRSPTPRTEVRNSLTSIDRVKIAETENVEFGLAWKPNDRIELRADVWRSDNSNEIRGIPPGGTQFESLGASRREGADFEVAFFFGTDTTFFVNYSDVEAALTTPINPLATFLPDIPEYVAQIGMSSALNIRSGRIAFGADASQVGQKNLNTLGTIRSEKYERIAANATYFSASAPVRVWIKGVNYPGSRYGESEFLFGPNIGVRPNPPLTLELGAGYTF